MHIKLVGYTFRWQRAKDIQIGTRVCPANVDSKVGVIVDISKRNADDYYEGRTVTVLWTTGKSKGTKSSCSCSNLVDFDKYSAAICAEAARLEQMKAESQAFGL